MDVGVGVSDAFCQAWENQCNYMFKYVPIEQAPRANQRFQIDLLVCTKRTACLLQGPSSLGLQLKKETQNRAFLCKSMYGSY